MIKKTLVWILPLLRYTSYYLEIAYISAAAKPVYSTNTTYNATPRVIAQPKVQAPAQVSSAATYVYPTVVTTQQPVSSYQTTYSGSNATTTVSYTSKGKIWMKIN